MSHDTDSDMKGIMRYAAALALAVLVLVVCGVLHVYGWL